MAPKYITVSSCMEKSIVLQRLLSIRKIFTRVLFRESSRMRSFAKIKPSRNSEINMSFTDVGESCPSCDF